MTESFNFLTTLGILFIHNLEVMKGFELIGYLFEIWLNLFLFIGCIVLLFDKDITSKEIGF